MEASGYGFQTLVREVVRSLPFQSRRGEAEQTIVAAKSQPLKPVPLARIVSLAAVAALSLATAQRADDLDTFIRAQMSQRQVNGLSLAIVQDGRIEARAYGVTSRGGAPVTDATLFQAGSISKPVAAMGALRLVEQGTLDQDVNTKLKSWKVPENEFTATEQSRCAGSSAIPRGSPFTVFQATTSRCRRRPPCKCSMARVTRRRCASTSSRAASGGIRAAATR